MDIAGISATFQHAEQFFDSYERENFIYFRAGVLLMATALQVLKSRPPTPGVPLTKPMPSAMSDDSRLTDAFVQPRL